MSRASGFIIDVPVTLSVAVRGCADKEHAKKIAREFADSLNPTDQYCQGYSDNLTGVYVTEATLESSREDSCEVMETLEAEEDEVPQ